MTGAIAAQLAIYGLTNGAVVALNAVGFTLAYGVARQINFAHGNVFALTTVVVASAAGALGVSAGAPMVARAGALILLVAIGACCAAVLNVGVERLAFAPFRKTRDPLGPLIAAVGLSFLARSFPACCCTSGGPAARSDSVACRQSHSQAGI